MPEAIAAPASTGGESVATSEPGNVQEVSTESTEIEAQGDAGAEATETQPSEQTQTTGKFDAAGLIKDPTKKEALKALDPALPGFIRDAVWSKKQIDAVGGLPALLETHKFITEVGGREFVENAKQELADWEGLDAAYIEGKPDFVKKLAEGDPESFAKMVPIALQEFAQINPEMYNHVQSRIFVNTFDGVGLTNALKGLLTTAGDAAKGGIQEIIDWVESFRATASKVPEKKVDAREQALTQKEQQFQQRQAEALVKSVDSDSIKHRDSIIAREIKPFGDWETMDPDRREAVASWVSSRIGKLLGADKAFLDRRNRLITSGDRDGLAKLEQQKLDERVPKLVPSAAKVFGVTKAAAKAGEKKTVATAATQPAAKGIVMLKSQPSASQIDRFKTKPDDIFKNQAILKDGRRVQWA
jgi:hypothetical protein